MKKGDIMSVKRYSLKKDGGKFLSPHFQVREFRSKDGSDKVYIESGLIECLERVFSHFDCLKINIVSGYRTESHDKAVGGRGAGNHVKGKAADFVAYGKDGKKISSREVTLYLEDIGIKGIGYRSGGSETSTHVDVNYRSKNWFGDEKKSMVASIGATFYRYLGVKYTENMAIATVRIRKEPSLSGTVVGLLKIGEKIDVSDCAKIKRDGYVWSKVRLGSAHYWIADRYLKEASA